MSVSLFTEKEVRGTGLSPRHGNISGGCMARLNQLITLANANETALSLTHGLAEVTATPYTVPANINIVLVDTATIGAPVVVNLPAATADIAGRRIVVVDNAGAGATNNIAITPDGTDQIDTVAGAVTIDDNYGGIAVICSEAGEWVTGPSYGSLGAHEAVTASAHGVRRAIVATVDLAAPGANPLTLNGAVTEQFIIEEIVAWVNAGAAGLNGDATFSAGTTPGGAELLGPAVPVGAAMTAANAKNRWVFAAEQPAIAGNAALDISIIAGDSGGGPATATFEIRGRVQG